MSFNYSGHLAKKAPLSINKGAFYLKKIAYPFSTLDFL